MCQKRAVSARREAEAWYARAMSTMPDFSRVFQPVQGSSEASGPRTFAERVERPRNGRNWAPKSATVHPLPNESIDLVLRRWKKGCASENIPAEIRRHEAYQKPSVRRREKSIAARRRLARLTT
jgi:small subunit ribosomal protein S21